MRQGREAEGREGRGGREREEGREGTEGMREGRKEGRGVEREPQQVFGFLTKACAGYVTAVTLSTANQL